MTDAAEASQKKTIGERLLSPIAEVRRDEIASAILLTLIMFLVLAAYYMLKTAREVFILGEGGAEVKSYSSAGQALLLLVIVPAYGAFASRVSRIQLVHWVTLFFASHLALFLLALSAGWHVGVPYFLWLGIFNLMVIAQFWAFASDIYTPDQGKRLFPLIGVGSSLGAWVGSVRAGQIVTTLGTSSPADCRRGDSHGLRVSLRSGRMPFGRVPRSPPPRRSKKRSRSASKTASR